MVVERYFFELNSGYGIASSGYGKRHNENNKIPLAKLVSFYSP